MISEEEGFLVKEKSKKQERKNDGYKKNKIKHVFMNPYEKPKNRKTWDLDEDEMYDEA